jgi:hypothetical protein
MSKADNDVVIKALMTKVEAQKKDLGTRPKAVLNTNGIFKYPDGSKHLTLSVTRDPADLVDALSTLLDKVSSREKASKLLGVPVPSFQWNGYSVEDYVADFKNRIKLLEWEAKKVTLDATQAKLSALVSEEARTEMELAEIAKLLQ